LFYSIRVLNAALILKGLYILIFWVIEFHRSIAKRQRLPYEKDRTDIPLDTLVIDLDFKQKIVIGDGPRQTNLTHYSQKQKSMLGFGLYYKDDNNQMQTMNINLISDCLTEDSFYVVSAFRFIRKQDFFIKIKKSKYKVWFDTGNHFRSAEVMHYLFEELKTEISVCNFFL
jgi:hypothetical protein